MWNVYNLLTGANKYSYIDNFLDRSLNATQLTEGLNKALYGASEYSWFIKSAMAEFLINVMFILISIFLIGLIYDKEDKRK